MERCLFLVEVTATAIITQQCNLCFIISNQCTISFGLGPFNLSRLLYYPMIVLSSSLCHEVCYGEARQDVEDDCNYVYCPHIDGEVGGFKEELVEPCLSRKLQCHVKALFKINRITNNLILISHQ
jgi:hypothetical protein